MYNAEEYGKVFMVSVAMKGNYSVINGPCFLDEAVMQADQYNGCKEKATVYDRNTGKVWFESLDERQWWN